MLYTIRAMMLTVVAGIAVAVVTFIIRFASRFGIQHYGSDACFHMKLAEVIRTERDRQQFVRWFSIGKYNDYPPVLHYLLAVLPKDTLERISAFISPAFDAANSALVYTFCFLLTDTWWVALIAALIYLATPQLQLESLSLTPRLLGLFFLNLWFVAMLTGISSASLIWTAGSIVAGVLAFFTVRSHLPFMLAGGALLWAVSGNSSYIALEAGVFVVAFLLNPSQAARTFKSYWIMTADAGRHWRDYGDERDRLAGVTGANREPSGIAAAVLKEIRMLFFYNPGAWVAVVAGLWLCGFEDNYIAISVRHLLWAWLLMTFAAFILAQRIPQLGQRGGDGYRQYPMFGAMQGSVLIAAALADSFGGLPAPAAIYTSHVSKPTFWLLAAGCACSLIMTLWMISPVYRVKLKASGSFMKPGLLAILKRIKSMPMGGVMCLHATSNYPMIYYGDKRIVGIVERSTPYRHLSQTYITGLKLPVETYIKMFNLDYFFIDTSNSAWRIDPADVGTVVDSEGSFILVKVRPELK